MATPKRLDLEGRAKNMKLKVEKGWNLDIKWELYPVKIRMVSLLKSNFSDNNLTKILLLG